MAKDVMSDEFGDAALSYDLRLYYAVIVGRRLFTISESLEQGNYVKCYESILDIYPFVENLIQDKDIDPEKNFKTINEKAIDVFKKYPGVYSGKAFNSQATYEIKTVLRELIAHAVGLMRDGGLFGKKYEYDPYEI